MVANSLYKAEKVLIQDLGLGSWYWEATTKMTIEDETLSKIDAIFSKFRGQKNEILMMFLERIKDRYLYDTVQISFDDIKAQAIISIEFIKCSILRGGKDESYI